MKKNNFGILAVMAILMGAMLLLNACSPKEPETSKGNSSTSESQVTAAPTELKAVDLIWYTIGTPQNDQDAVNKAMSDITKEKINATISINTIGWGEYNDRMTMLMSSGEEFDLCFTSSWANDYHTAVRNGAYAPLDELLDEYGQDIFSQVPKKYFEAARVDGKIYAMINYQILARLPSNIPRILVA